jgi:hypothetical protein
MFEWRGKFQEICFDQKKEDVFALAKNLQQKVKTDQAMAIYPAVTSC